MVEANAPTGRPPPIIFPKHTISALTPYNSWAPPLDNLKPVITSSNIRRILLMEHNFLKFSRNPFSGGIQPIFPATGSIIIQAISFLFDSIILLTLLISL